MACCEYKEPCLDASEEMVYRDKASREPKNTMYHALKWRDLALGYIGIPRVNNTDIKVETEWIAFDSISFLKTNQV